jgi:outer membrane lipoprotein SlyB
MAAVLATAAGSVVGAKIEKAMDAERLVRIHVLLENGKEEIVTQPANGTKFKSLDKVKILRYRGKRNRVFLRDANVEFETNPYE